MAAAMEVDMAADTEVMLASVAAAAVGWRPRPHRRRTPSRRTFPPRLSPRRFLGGGLYAYNGYGCWRWYPGIYGYVRVWVC